MVAFLAVPMALTVVWSVFERTTFWMKPGFTLFAYETFFTSARAENYLFSMFHAAIAVVISFALAFPIAVFVRRRVAPAAQHRVVLLFILPFMISELVRVFALRPILGRNGLINSIRILEIIAWVERAVGYPIEDTQIRTDNFYSVQRIADVFLKEESHVVA